MPASAGLKMSSVLIWKRPCETAEKRRQPPFHQRLLNLARQSGRPFNELAQYYALERWLYRLAQSDYRNQFVLKGALMLLVWKMPVTRPTRDIDLVADPICFTDCSMGGVSSPKHIHKTFETPSQGSSHKKKKKKKKFLKLDDAVLLLFWKWDASSLDLSIEEIDIKNKKIFFFFFFLGGGGGGGGGITIF